MQYFVMDLEQNIKNQSNIVNERGCNRMRFYRILVTVPLKYKKHQEN